LANTIALKRRIGSVRNTRQITKAMELVAASKMRRAQEYAQRSRTYREAAHSLLVRLNNLTDVNTHPLFTKRAVKTRIYVVITSNRGLAGAYNANIMRLLARSVLKDRDEHIKSRVVAIGKQGANFVRRLEGVELVAAYSAFTDHPTANELRPVLNMVVEMYQTEAVDDVKLLYTKFKSNIVQEAKRLAILPTRFEPEEGEEADVGQELSDVTFEPSVTSVLDNVAVRLIEVQIWQAMLESIASEHSMRMLAMKNATDNASELIDDLTLEFNTARQAAITQELAEITGGAEAIQ
jgi:F-type H+-transporting ATPase subunit gamma